MTYKPVLSVALLSLVAGAAWLVMTYSTIILPFIAYPSRAAIGPFEVGSDQPLNDEQTQALERAAVAAGNAPVSLDDLEVDLFIDQVGTSYSEAATQIGLSSRSQGFAISRLGRVFVSIPNIDSVRNEYGQAYPRTMLSEGLEHIVLHEACHIWVHKRVASNVTTPLPRRIEEGVCELIAAESLWGVESSASIRARIQTLDTDVVRSLPRIRQDYLRVGSLAAYLRVLEGEDIIDILATGFDVAAVEERAKRWVRSPAISEEAATP